MVVVFALIGDDVGDSGISHRILIMQLHHLPFQMLKDDALDGMGGGGDRATAQHGGEQTQCEPAQPAQQIATAPTLLSRLQALPK